MDGWRSTYGKCLDLLGHGGLFTDRLRKLVDDKFSVGWENTLAGYWVVEVETLKWCSADSGLVEVHIALQ